MAAAGELWWPSAGRFVSVYGEDLMAADIESCRGHETPGQEVCGHRLAVCEPYRCSTLPVPRTGPVCDSRGPLDSR